ncbi:MAG: SpoIIE family protein phosphatase [Deltaproteobacteria bacterium]|nr:SpoIIE family protein phosphatase [Deltaproteobacteria bacterium]
MPEILLQATIKNLQELLTARTVPTEPPEELRGVEGFEYLHSTLLEVRTAVMAFASGDLGRQITRKGYLPGSLKALQAALQHLAWQTKMIASGDFSQRVDFMGEFSESFNSMVQQLDESMQKLTVANRRLEESQTRIQESLNCAKVIQSSILPRNEQFDRLFSDWFALYRPCDIVGGDLYWLREIDGHILLAVIDCTGHGVPGAFMTMTVNSVLNHIVDTICSDNPARILSEMNRVLQETLHLRLDNNSMVDAGLDMVVCCIDPAKRRLTYAGAGLSLYIFADDGLCEIKGDRAGIGYSSSEPGLTFTNHVRDLGAGTICYAITDGFLDEGGGSRGFGFGRQRFKEMVERYADHPLRRQQGLFEQTLDEWRGSRKQRDDITVVGFRF